jgi:uncharacterized membrane protein (Fun14 family)
LIINHFSQPLLNNIGGGFLLGVDLGYEGKSVVWLEYGIVGMRIGNIVNPIDINFK